MELSNADIQAYTRRILKARMRLLCTNGFYGMLLMNAKIGLGNEYETAWAEEDKLVFNPDFLAGISDSELEYVMLHLLLHQVLNHLERRGSMNKEEYDIASDIVVNSNILRSQRGLTSAISLKGYGGVQPHLTPNGDEGWKYTVEEVYGMLKAEVKESKDDKKGDKRNIGIVGNHTLSFDDEKDPEESNENEESNGESDENNQPNKDDSLSGNKKDIKGKKNPSSKKGWDSHPESEKSDNDKEQTGDKEKKQNADKWKNVIYMACELMAKRAEMEEQPESSKEIKKNSKDYGDIPLFAEMLLKELKEPKVDWRTILEEFIQEDVVDYSFIPPDRRFDDSPFFLPDFNEKDEKIKGIWIAIDASGSVSDEAVMTAISEIKGCIDQFDGKFSAKISFFDVHVTEPIPIEGVDELLNLKPVGRGGTSFSEVFEYMRENMSDELPDEVIVITDGYCDYPDESARLGIPVLWMINNEEAEKPPWGKVARFEA